MSILFRFHGVAKGIFPATVIIAALLAVIPSISWGQSIITVLAPHGGETWYYGSAEYIEWSEGTGVGPEYLDFYYSTDTGSTWNMVAHGVAAGSSPYYWPIPDVDSSNCLFRITQPSTAISGQSAAVFTIVGEPGTPTPSLTPTPSPSTTPTAGPTVTPSAVPYIWSGLDCSFSKANYAAWTDPGNQDWISSNVHITRKNNSGIYNIVLEAGYQGWDVSPMDTEWAFSGLNGCAAFSAGSGAVQYQSLTFDSFARALNVNVGDYIVGTPGVVHLISENIYIDILCTSWQTGGAGGGFAWDRACEPSPTPTTTPPPTVTPTSSVTPSATPTATLTPTVTPTPSTTPTTTPALTPSIAPSPYPTPEYLVLDSGDYNGDGIADLAVYRPDQGVWIVRDLGRTYFGRPGDIPVPGDYNGDGLTNPSYYRPSLSLWAVKDQTRIYLGAGPDSIPAPADYDGDGTCDPAIFDPGAARWVVPGITRAWFGKDGDLPVPEDYDGDGLKDMAVFRPSSGLWIIRDLTRFYFGQAGDVPVPGVYQWTIPSLADPAVFRANSKLWIIRDLTRIYFGEDGDTPLSGHFENAVIEQPAYFRPGSKLWKIKDVSRVYFGKDGDIPVTR